MRRKSKKNIKLLAIPLLLIIGAIALLDTDNLTGFLNTGFKTNDINNGLFSTTSGMVGMDLFENTAMDCETILDLYITTKASPSENDWKLIQSDNDFFNTFIRTSITDPETGEKINQFRVDSSIRCIASPYGIGPLVNTILVSGTQFFTVSSSDNGAVGGSETLKQGQITVSKNIPMHEKTKVSEYRFSSTEIEPKLALNSSGESWIHVAQGFFKPLKLTMNLDNGDTYPVDTGVYSIPSYVQFKVDTIDDAPPIEDDANRRNAVIDIFEVIQQPNNKDIDGGTMDLADGRRVSVKAVMRDFDPKEGQPQLQIVSGTLNTKINMVLLHYENDNDGIFESNFALADYQTGSYSLKMSHVNRVTTSTASFTVIDTNAEIPTCPSGQFYSDTVKKCVSNPGDPEGLTNPQVQVHYHWNHFFVNVPDGENSQKTVTGDSERKNLILLPASLVDTVTANGRSVEGTLQDIQLDVFVKAEWEVLHNLRESTGSSVKYQASVTPEGGNTITWDLVASPISTRNPCFGTTSPNQCTPGMGVDINFMKIGASTIERKLTDNGVKSEGQDIVFEVKAVSGTFTIRDNAGKEHIGTATGLTYTSVFKFGATPVQQPDNSCKTLGADEGCACPQGQEPKIVTGTNVLQCVDSVTKEPTPDPPKKVPTPPQEPQPEPETPHCETIDGVFIMYGEVSASSPGCSRLAGGGDDPQPECNPPEVWNSVSSRCEIPITGPTDCNVAIPDPSCPTGEPTPTPLPSCEDVWGVTFCAFAEDPEGYLAGQRSCDDNGFCPPDEPLDLTIVGILLALVVIIVTVAVVLKKKKRVKLYSSY